MSNIQPVDFIPAFIEDFPILIMNEDDVTTSWKRKLAVHTFPYSPEKEIDDQSFNEDALTLDFMLDNEYTKDQSPNVYIKRLETLLKTRPLVTLTHPVYSRVQIRVISFQATYSLNEKSARFSIEFELENPINNVEEQDIFSADTRLQEVLEEIPSVNVEMILEQSTNLKDVAGSVVGGEGSVFSKAAAGVQSFNRAKDAAVLRVQASVENFTVAYNNIEKKLEPVRDGISVLDDLNDDARSAVSQTFGRVNSTIRAVLSSRNALISRALHVKGRVQNSLRTFLDIFSPEDPNDIINDSSEIIGYLAFSQVTKELVSGVSGTSRSDLLKVTAAIMADISNSNLASQVSAREDGGIDKDFLQAAEELAAKRANKLLEYTIYSNQIAALINELSNSSVDGQAGSASLFNVESFSAIRDTLNLLKRDYRQYLNEKGVLALDELSNAFYRFNEEARPFLFDTVTVNASDTLISDALYEENGDLNLLEETMELNGVFSSAPLSGVIKLYKQN
jgi:predicted secreted protein